MENLVAELFEEPCGFDFTSVAQLFPGASRGAEQPGEPAEHPFTAIRLETVGLSYVGAFPKLSLGNAHGTSRFHAFFSGRSTRSTSFVALPIRSRRKNNFARRTLPWRFTSTLAILGE